MAEQKCCDQADIRWRHKRVGDRFAEIQYCASCDRVHATDTYVVPLQFPSDGWCVNCGGPLEPETVLDTDPREPEFQCAKCGFYNSEALTLHEQYAKRIAGTKSLLDAAMVTLDEGRFVMTIKLASALLRNHPKSTEGRTLRLECLKELGMVDRAITEAWRWTEDDSNPLVWTVMANLELTRENVDAALSALQKGLRRHPNHLDMWLEYAELLESADQRPTAMDAAMHVLPDLELQDQAVEVMHRIALKYYAEKTYDKAIAATVAIGDLLDHHVEMLWLRAQIAAVQNDADEAVRWLQQVLSIAPDHAQAQAALKTIKPEKKKTGWRFW